MLVILLVTAASAYAEKDCSRTSFGITPLNDLGTDDYQGEEGGLYPEGSNQRPLQHELAGIREASQVIPRDAAGEYDPVNGKIVFTSIGMSNCRQEFARFMKDASLLPGLNPYLVLFNGAIGGMTIEDMVDDDAAYWTILRKNLAQNALDPDQVQVVWLKQSYDIPPIDTFPGHAQMTAVDLGRIARNIKGLFPNVRLCYFTSRIYGGYTTNYYRSEPLMYETAFGYKWLIEAQIEGEPSLNYDPDFGPVRAPWFSWGPYMWADGLVPRSDGLIWECADFEDDDGYHPADGAKQKMSDALIDFFTSDPTAVGWFLGN